MLGEPESSIHLRPQIQKALDHAGNVLRIEDLYAHVLAGSMQLWLSHSGDAIMFTEIVCYPQLKAIRATIAAGHLESLLAMTPRIAQWAAGIGCTRAEFIGRPGWLRVWRGKFRNSAAFGAAPIEELLP